MSVFLALAVGILVGASLGSSERQAATIQTLQRDVAAIRAEDTQVKAVNAELQHRLAAREAAEQQDLLPLMVRGRLAGNRVGMILTGGDAAEAMRPAVTRALRNAGADLLVIRLPRGDSSPQSDPDADKGVDKPAQESSLSTHSGPSGSEAAAGTLARALLAGRPALLEIARTRMPDLEVIGELRAPIHRLLLLCPNDQPDYARRVAAGAGVDAAIVHAARDAGALVVAAEPEAALDAGHDATPGSAAAARSREATSLLATFAALGAATVDNADSALGQIAIVLALAGAQGQFGSGPGASSLLPPAEAGAPRAAARSASPGAHPSP
jgi:hypothetical protein